MEQKSDSSIDFRLYTHVDRLAGLIGPRHVRRPDALRSAATLIERELAAHGEPVEHHTYHADGLDLTNLILERRGTTRPDEIVILGAHYDTTPTTPGADDNASAVAVLLEAARLLHGRSFQRTIRFVAFTCEEMPHFHTNTMGSGVYARRCRERNENIVSMLCLEMVGYYRDEPGSQQLPPSIPRLFRPVFPSRGNFLAAVGNLRSWRLCWSFRRGFKKATPFPLYSIVLPELIQEIHLSDNRCFWAEGYPALMLTDTSFLRNPHYHLAGDTPETLDYKRMAEVTIGVAGGMARIARRA